jgi:hypothetical protein
LPTTVLRRIFFFDLDQPPRPFQRVSAAKDETYFLNDKTVPTDPDDD